MGEYSRTYNLTNGTTAMGDQVVFELDALGSSVNNIVGAQISSGAAISDNKLSVISTSGKVDCSALINSENIPSAEVNGASQLVQMTSDTKLPAIDGSLLTGITTKNILGAWNPYVTGTTKWSYGTAYLAATDGFVTGTGATNSYITIASDASNPPTVVRLTQGVGSGVGGGVCPIRKGDYWKVNGGTAQDIYWISMGL